MPIRTILILILVDSRQDKARQDKARQDKARQDKARRDEIYIDSLHIIGATMTMTMTIII